MKNSVFTVHLLSLVPFLFHLEAFAISDCASVGLANGPPPCLPLLTNVISWQNHSCTGTAGFLGASQPSPNLTAGSTVNNIYNRRLACCLRGAQSPGYSSNAPTAAQTAPYRFDCLETVVTPTSTFSGLYNEFATANFTSSGLTFPNRLYLVDNQGEPISGFYRANGERCVVAGTPAQVIALMETAITNATNNTSSALPNGVPDACRFVLRTLLVAQCPPPQTVAPNATTPLMSAAGPGGRTRCRVASQFRIFYELTDTTHTTRYSRSRFATITNLNNSASPAFTMAFGALLNRIDATVWNGTTLTCPIGMHVGGGGVCEF